MRFLELFAGVGGFYLACTRAGMTCVGQSEIDKYALRVLRKRCPDVPQLGDVENLHPARGSADLVCGGSPCQDISVAGGRAGLAGDRSRLFFDLVRCLDESGATWLLFENVDGLLSSNYGEDMAVVIGAITGYRPIVPEDGWRSSGLVQGPRRGCAWRLLDAQYFGLAQRRLRLVLVGHPRAEVAGAVLHDAEGRAGDPAQDREAVPFAAGGVAHAIGSVGGGDDPGAQKGTLVVDGYAPAVAYSLRASEEKQNGSPERGDMTLVAVPDVAYAMRAEGHDASEDGSGRQPGFVVETFRKSARAQAAPEHGGFETWVPAPIANTVNTFDEGDIRSTELVVETQTVASLLTAGGVTSGYRSEDDVNLVAETQPLARTLTAQGERGGWRHEDEVNLVATGPSRVRRLTLTEKELLQGFTISSCLVGRIRVTNDSPTHPARGAADVSLAPLREDAQTATGDQSSASANRAASDSQPSRPSGDKPVDVSVLIDFGQDALVLRNPARSWSPANAADASVSFPRHMPRDVFARLVALLRPTPDRQTPPGKVASPMSAESSSIPASGSNCVELSGREVAALVDDAGRFTEQALTDLRSITSEVGPDSRASDSTRRTLCCFVLAAIAGSIPVRTRNASSFAFELRVANDGWTCMETDNYGLLPSLEPYDINTCKCKDAPRSRCLGNAIAVNQFQWVAMRIAAVGLP